MADKRLRMTRQRQIILDELKKTKDHPSASDLYEVVKQRLPHISLGTVYRNLEILSAEGVILRLETPSSQRRFDATVKEHHHIRCTSCGKISDIPSIGHDNITRIVQGVSSASGYDDIGCTVDFYGLCPECSKEKTLSTTDKKIEDITKR